MHTLHLDLTVDYTRPAAQALGAHTFGGAGGAGISLSASSAPSGDGKSGASSYGAHGGFVSGDEIKATFTSTPTVTAYIAGQLVRRRRERRDQRRCQHRRVVQRQHGQRRRLPGRHSSGRAP